MSNWQPIPKFEGRYEINEDGLVRSLAREVNFSGRVSIERVIKTDKYGYVCLHKWGFRYRRKVDDLLKEVFND